MTAWIGVTLFISFSTPAGEVNGVEPVKFVAKRELRAPMQPTILIFSRMLQAPPNSAVARSPRAAPETAPFNTKDRNR